MSPFFRAVQDATRYWHLLALSVVCSAGVAALWGANIAALFPILEVTLHGKSLQEWNVELRERAEKNIRELTEKVAAAEQANDTREKRRAEARLHIEETQLASANKTRPYLERFAPSHPYHTILLIVALLMGSNVAKHVLLVGNNMLVGFVSGMIAKDIRTKLFDKALLLDRPTYMGIGTGGFAAQITQSTDMLAQGIAGCYGGCVTEPLKIIACLLGAWMISWRLTLCSLLVAPVVTLMILWLNRRIRSVARRTLDRSLGFHHVILESLNNLLTVQAFTMEPFERERFRKSTDAMLKNSLRATFYTALAGPITEVLGIGMVCTAILVGSYLVMYQETHIFGIRIVDQPLSVPGLMVFFGMLISTNDPVRKLAGVITWINSGSVAAQSLYGMLDLPSRIADPAEPKSPASPHSRLALRGVHFSYDGQHEVLKNVDLEIPLGQRVAIVGPNGGGKSTLINLLCRFYDPTRGEILLDDVPLRQMSLRDLRGRIALVNQHTELFNESILFNIRYGRLDATDQEVIEAARKAHAHEFVDEFPEKYATLVGPNGHRLSGGQRQRIALARAILRDAELLVLDEATSQIDVASERLIHDALAAFSENRTVLMITHRASTLALADIVLEIRHGVVTIQPPDRLAA